MTRAGRYAWLGAALTTLAACGGSVRAAGTSGRGAGDGRLATSLRALDRSAVWTRVACLDLRFPTYHPEGLVVTPTRIYLSSTQTTEEPEAYAAPSGGFDRTPGKGIGHLFIISRAGALIRDIVLGHDIVYHPGGVDFDGASLWVPVAQNRPSGVAEVDRVDVETLTVSTQFKVADHVAGVVFDASTGHLVGNNWGSRTFFEWSPDGRELDRWRNPEAVLDLQDCQYIPRGKIACGGITDLPQPPGADPARPYELGGLVLLDLRAHSVLNEVPFQHWSRAGHVMTRNPVKFASDGQTLTLYAAPDNGDEGEGTQICTWTTPSVAPARGTTVSVPTSP